ncbi:amidohydrolase family protein [Anaerosalibacter bizertensis]|uniref:amidohydrolase family protein n=1 Tax=Anaerosalibacter bizertensis TaxID=932217 RepID=UPI001FD37F30|nr:amidohydrolase family protein [Anaerosalibacter bizertensis]
MRNKQQRGHVIAFILVGILIFNLFPLNLYAEGENTYDIVIKGGTIYNPSTEHELKGYNLGIIGDKIARITMENISGKEEIDASGLVVSPGFIDLISYDPNHVGIRLKVLDGVTSNLAMHGGTDDAENWYRIWSKNKVITNFGASSFVTRHRWPIIGQNVDATIENEEDINKIVEDVRKNIETGALGISFSLEYVPGVKNEIIPLLNLAKELNAPTFFHLRYSDEKNGLKGIEEVVNYGKKAGAPIHIMHINSTGGTFHMDKALEMVNDAKNEGLDITACVYPYDFWATYIDSARFRPGWQDRFKISYENLQIGGTDIRITEDTFDKYRSQHLLVAAHGSLPEDELIMSLKDPEIMIGSDTIIEPSGNNHPRGSGTYSRLFGRYVREKQVLSMMDAIKKTSYLPAKRMEDIAPSMKNKGRIEIGSDADITIFNPDTIIDKSTVKESDMPSEGVEYVIVNGVVVKNSDGIVEGVYPGRPIKSYFAGGIPENKPIDFSLNINDKAGDLKNVYKVNDETYISIKELSTALYLNIKDDKDGNINLNDSLNIKIGNRKAVLKNKDINLKTEPIIYKGNVYINSSDLDTILNDKYNIDISNNAISLKYREKESSENPSTSDNNKKTYIGISIFSILLIAFVLTLDKNKK